MVVEGGIAWDIIHITLQWEWSSISQAGGSFVFYSGFPQRSADADTTLNITQEGGVNGLSLVLAPSLSQCVFRKCTNIPGWAVLLCWPTTGGIRLIAAACVCVCVGARTHKCRPPKPEHTLPSLCFCCLSSQLYLRFWSVACMSWTAAIPLPPGTKPCPHLMHI